jgi:hypothetical protein
MMLDTSFHVLQPGRKTDSGMLRIAVVREDIVINSERGHKKHLQEQEIVISLLHCSNHEARRVGS